MNKVELKSRIQPVAILCGVVADKLLFILAAGFLSKLVPTDAALFSALALLIGFACTTFGAFIAAHRARRMPMSHGLLVALIAFLISFTRYLWFSFNPPDTPGAVHSFGWEVLGWILVFAAGALGGAMARLRATRHPTGI